MSATRAVGSVTGWVVRRERVRSLRVQRHLLVAALAALACALVAPISDTLGGFALVSVLVFATLNSLARALDARLGYLWGWLYGEPVRTTRLDALADRVVQALFSDEPGDEPPPSRIRPIGPETR